VVKNEPAPRALKKKVTVHERTKKKKKKKKEFEFFFFFFGFVFFLPSEMRRQTLAAHSPQPTVKKRNDKDDKDGDDELTANRNGLRRSRATLGFGGRARADRERSNATVLVRQVDLSDGKTRGHWPRECVQGLTLQILRVNANEIERIPRELLYAQVHSLGWRTTLIELDLRSNQLRSLPVEITQLASLRTLLVSDNRLKRLPAEASGWRSLETLDVARNRLNALPTQLSLCLRLKTLNVDGNPLKSPPERFVSRGLHAMLAFLSHQARLDDQQRSKSKRRRRQWRRQIANDDDDDARPARFSAAVMPVSASVSASSSMASNSGGGDSRQLRRQISGLHRLPVQSAIALARADQVEHRQASDDDDSDDDSLAHSSSSAITPRIQQPRIQQAASKAASVRRVKRGHRRKMSFTTDDLPSAPARKVAVREPVVCDLEQLMPEQPRSASDEAPIAPSIAPLPLTELRESSAEIEAQMWRAGLSQTYRERSPSMVLADFFALNFRRAEEAADAEQSERERLVDEQRALQTQFRLSRQRVNRQAAVQKAVRRATSTTSLIVPSSSSSSSSQATSQPTPTPPQQASRVRSMTAKILPSFVSKKFAGRDKGDEKQEKDEGEALFLQRYASELSLDDYFFLQSTPRRVYRSLSSLPVAIGCRAAADELLAAAAAARRYDDPSLPSPSSPSSLSAADIDNVYGCVSSTYPLRNPTSDSLEREGSPPCDTFRFARIESAGISVAVVADGCGWGEKSRRAAIDASGAFVDYALRLEPAHCETVRDVGFHMLRAMAHAHNAVTEFKAEWECGTTTLVGAMIVPVDDADNDNGDDDDNDDDATTTTTTTFLLRRRMALVVCSVGDCKVALHSADTHQVVDVTAGNRQNLSNPCDPGGRLGACNDNGSPDLRNLSLYYANIFEGDLLMLMSDGVHDNMDAETLGLQPRDFGIDGPRWDDVPLAEGDRCKSLFMQQQLARILVNVSAARETTPPKRIVDAVIDHCHRVTEPTRHFLETQPMQRVPQDYRRFPGKPDHTTFLCFRV
jgi:serine/threonine protein phosphatase PrpC